MGFAPRPDPQKKEAYWAGKTTIRMIAIYAIFWDCLAVRICDYHAPSNIIFELVHSAVRTGLAAGLLGSG